MFGIITAEVLEQVSWVKKPALWLSNRPLNEKNIVSVGSATFLHIHFALPEQASKALLRHKLSGAARVMRQHRIRRVVCPFPGLPDDITPIGRRPAVQAAASDAAAKLCASLDIPPQELCVVICADRVSREVQASAIALAKYARFVRLELGYSDGSLERCLYERFGITPYGEIPANVKEIALVFDQGRKVPQVFAALNATGGKLDLGEIPLYEYDTYSTLFGVMEKRPVHCAVNEYISALLLFGGLSYLDVFAEIVMQPSLTNAQV